MFQENTNEINQRMHFIKSLLALKINLEIFLLMIKLFKTKLCFVRLQGQCVTMYAAALTNVLLEGIYRLLTLEQIIVIAVCPFFDLQEKNTAIKLLKNLT